MAWLRRHRSAIAAQEAKRRVDRRAIAGAIAWKALENPIAVSGGRGPGKLHFAGAPVVEQVEQPRYVAKQRSVKQRFRDFARPGIAIDYIGAIMQAYADVTERSGFPDVHCDVDVLTHVYQGPGGGLDHWRSRLRQKRSKELKLDNPMARWSVAQLDYLTAAVGAPEPAICSGSPLYAAPDR